MSAYMKQRSFSYKNHFEIKEFGTYRQLFPLKDGPYSRTALDFGQQTENINLC